MSAAEIKPPVEDSAIAIVCLRSVRTFATFSAIATRSFIGLAPKAWICAAALSLRHSHEQMFASCVRLAFVLERERHPRAERHDLPVLDLHVHLGDLSDAQI